jgi:serine protease
MQRHLRPILLAILALALGASPALAAPRPNDPDFGSQWAFGPAKKYGMDVLRAWDFSRGKGVVVAVIDSGFIGASYYPDFGARILPGYDFISDVSDARDGDGRDGYPTDPGNWCDEDGFTRSTWHGTKVASIIGATAGNRTATAGVAPQASIVFVRTSGACGFSDGDDAGDAILWAAGLPVPGTPLNEHPARIINISSGAVDSSCSEQDAINQATLAGSIVVVAAGNDNQLADDDVYTNCDNVISVAATDGRGVKNPYSNFGEKVDIAAPVYGDRCDDGAIVPYFDTERWAVSYSKRFYSCSSGTSFGAPLVSGALALAASYDPTTSSSDLIELLLANVTPFGGGTAMSVNPCLTLTACGRGIVSAGKLLVAMSKRGQPTLALTSATTIDVGTTTEVTFSANAPDGTPLEGAEGVLSSLTPAACSAEGFQLTSITADSCRIRIRLNGTVSTAPKTFEFVLDQAGLDIEAEITYLSEMAVKSTQMVSAISYADFWTVTSTTKKVCTVRSGGILGYEVVAKKRGVCTLRASFDASDQYEHQDVLFSISVQ